jgi:hypothetical protein
LSSDKAVEKVKTAGLSIRRWMLQNKKRMSKQVIPFPVRKLNMGFNLKAVGDAIKITVQRSLV